VGGLLQKEWRTMLQKGGGMVGVLCKVLKRCGKRRKLVLLDVLVQLRGSTVTYCNTLQHAATRCNTLQHAVTRCNTLQHAATQCNVRRREDKMWTQVEGCVARRAAER